jgi:dihydrofolate reductase
MIILIAAVAKNWAIGKNNTMLWHLPNDFKHFKNKTSNHIIVMGRKTFESLPGVLPNRKHIIITRNQNYKVPENCIIANSLEQIINEYGHEILYIIGGGEIYKQAIPYANKIELTVVNTSFYDADAYFPEINLKEWNIINSEKHKADDKHIFDYEFITLLKAN